VEGSGGVDGEDVGVGLWERAEDYRDGGHVVWCVVYGIVLCYAN
jgi:hypothetical protein